MAAVASVFPVVGCVQTTCTGTEPLLGSVFVVNSCDGATLQLTVDLSPSDSFVAGGLLGVAYRSDRFPLDASGCPVTSGFYADTGAPCPLAHARTYCVDLSALGLADRKGVSIALQVAYSATDCPSGPPLLAHVQGGARFGQCPATCAISPPDCLTAVNFTKASCF
jgi:hypothetical protein